MPENIQQDHTEHQHNQQKLNDILQKKLNICSDFLNLLQQEIELLKARDLIVTEQLYYKKQLIMQDLSEHQKQCDIIQKQYNLPTGNKGLKQLLDLEHFFNNQELSLLRKKLINVINKIQQATFINSQVINMQYTQSIKILNMVYNNPQTDLTYSKQGKNII